MELEGRMDNHIQNEINELHEQLRTKVFEENENGRILDNSGSQGKTEEENDTISSL